MKTQCGFAVWLSQRGVRAARPGDSELLGAQWQDTCCPTLAGGAAVPGWREGVAAAQRLTGPAAAGHEASEAGTHVAGLSGIRKLLAAQV